MLVTAVGVDSVERQKEGARSEETAREAARGARDARKKSIREDPS